MMTLCTIGALAVLPLAESPNTPYLYAIIIGFALGLVTYFTIPDLMPANDWLTALFIGGASGWAATGANQFIKKLKSLLGKGE